MHKSAVRGLLGLLLIIMMGVAFTPPAFAQYQVYKANLHVHTNVSYEPSESPDHAACSNPSSTISDAASHGLNVIGLSDHGGAIDSGEWSTLHNVADAHTGGNPVVLRGFEWTLNGAENSDHINVFGTTSYTDVQVFGNGTPPVLTQNLSSFYEWLTSAGMDSQYGASSHRIKWL
ncbi:MAG: hypothetical protein ACYC64_19300 [Armatimonadota bacterium]